MKLILLSTADFFVEEDTIINALFEEGLDLLHLRKPGTEPVYSERLLTLLPEQWHNQIVVHEHFYLKEEFNPDFDYLFLSPVFNSITYPDRNAAFTPEMLSSATRAGLIDRKVMAAGGVNSDTLPLLKDYGFGGAVILGDLWTRFNIHSGLDYKEVIAHFRKLRKAAG